MYNESITLRPRNGLAAEAYWEIRYWCDKNGFTFSDVFNSMIVPLAYYLNNFCEIDHDRSIAKVALNIGDLQIAHVWGGKCYPLQKDKVDNRKVAFTLEELQERIEYWKKRNKEHREEYDLILTEK